VRQQDAYLAIRPAMTNTHFWPTLQNQVAVLCTNETTPNFLSF